MKRATNIAVLLGVAAIVTSGLTIAANQAFVGKREYTANCASCHGPGGKGDGPFAASLKLKMNDLTLLTKNNGGEFPSARVFSLIDGRDEVQGHGPRDMPVWGDDYLAKSPRDDSPANREEFVRQRIHALMDYLKTLQAN